MSVRALLQTFEENDRKASSPPTSPPRRNSKPPLRINTPSLKSEEEIRASAASLAAQASQAAAANASRRTKSTPSALFTPNSAHTFGRPNLSLESSEDSGPQLASASGQTLDAVSASPSNITPTSSLPTPPDTAQLASRRAERYNHDEQQLVAAATPNLPEFSPRTLQKFELARAQSLLAERAAAARARVTELRQKLSRHDLDPAEHTALQQERWKQERWADAAEQQLARLKEAETVLKETPPAKTQPEVPAVGVSVGRPVKTVLDADARRRANLAKFFAQSPTHVTAHTRNRSRVMILTSHPAGGEPNLELKLRDWPIGAELRRQSSANLRPRSLDGTERTGPPAAERLGHGSARKKSRRVPPALPLDKDATSGSTVQEWVYSAPAHTGVVRFPRAPPVHVDYTLDETPDGKAVVYNRTVLPTREEILAGAKPDTEPLNMPSYVSALLDEFDFEMPDFVSALALPEPEPAPAPAPKLSRASTARISTTRPSTTRMSTATSHRISSASPPMLPAHTPLPLLTLTLSRRASIDTLGSAVLVSRPSIDSYHYPQQRQSKLRISRSFRSSMHFGGSSSTVGGEGGEDGARGPRVRKPSFLRPRTESSGEDGGMMDRVRKRVSVLGKR
ncbi:unnamed protein product [Peniophora sp. CBMAI 1063]|nr:unnamed protein product [Peniophora sp. CBMAI 1063]